MVIDLFELTLLFFNQLTWLYYVTHFDHVSFGVNADIVQSLLISLLMSTMYDLTTSLGVNNDIVQWPLLLMSLLMSVMYDVTMSLGVFTSLNDFCFLLVVVFCYKFYSFVFQVSQLLLFFCCEVIFTYKYWCRCLY